MTLTIRPYKPDDEVLLLALYRLVFADMPPWCPPAEMIRRKYNMQPEGLLVGFDAQGELIATVMAGYDGHRGWINALGVHPHHRGQGFGQALITHALDVLAKMGAVKVNLQIRGDSVKLREYYKGLGFEEEDRISMGILTPEGVALSKN